MKAQKELKEIYHDELLKAWSSSEMVNHCLKHVGYIVEHNGELYGIEKPTIKKDFCFGYGMYGRSTEEEEWEANKMAQMARTDRNYFITENLKTIDNEIKKLENIAEEMHKPWAEGNRPTYMVETNIKYYGQKDSCKLRGFSIVNTFDRADSGNLCEDIELIEKLIDGYKQVRADFTKRLTTYLNKYGLSGVNTWAYLVD